MTNVVIADQLIDDAPLGKLQGRIFAVCLAVSFADGFDTQALAFAAPSISQQWQVSPEAFGIAFGAGLLGALFGALAGGPASDRFGRRPTLMVALGFFCVGSLACAFASGISDLTIWRTIVGIGLGAAVPCLVPVVAEYSPRRLRATAITILFWGFPLGAFLGAMVSSILLSFSDWRSIFLFGAALPLVLGPVVYRWFPESLRLLPRTHEGLQHLRETLETISGKNLPAEAEVRFTDADADASANPKELFSSELLAGTLLSGLLFFSTLMLTYFLVNWIPLILQSTGSSTSAAVTGAGLFNLGGVLGSLGISRMTDRLGITKVLPLFYGIGAIVIVLIGVSDIGENLRLTFIFIGGVCCLGAQLTCTAVVALFFPPRLLGSASGWTMGVGRLGSLLGPVGAGYLLGMKISLEHLFQIAALPAFVSAAAVLLLGVISKPKSLVENSQ